MALAFRANGTFVDANGTSSGAIGLPAGLANGDHLILPIQARGTAGTVNTPSGYTRAADINITASHRLVVFYKYVTNAAGEAAPTVTQTVSGAIRGRLTAFSGGDTTPLDVVAQTGKKTAQTTFAAKSITPVTAGAMALWIFSSGDDNALGSATQGTTAYTSDGTAGTDGSVALVYELQTNAAATGTCTMTQSANGPDNWNTVTLALRPLAVAAANPSRDIGYDGISYAVEMAFGESAFSPTPVWTDVSAYVRAEEGITITRGRNTEFSDTQTGSMSLTLNNRDRRFDPDYSSGPYFGQLLPQTRVRLRVRQASVNYPIFDGWVRSFDQAYLYPREAVAQVTAFDLFARLATRKLPAGLLPVLVLGDTPHAYFPMQEEEGRNCGDLSGNGWNAYYGNSVQHHPSIIPGEPQSFSARLETFSPLDGGDASIFNAADVTVENIRTVEAWLKIGVTDTTQAPTGTVFFLLMSATSNQLSVGIVYNTSGTGGIGATEEDSLFTLQAAVGGFDTSTVAGTLTAPLQDGVTYHVVVTLDSAYTTHSLYLDGQLIATQDVSAGTFEGGTRATAIGAFTGDRSEMYLSHVATYEETLTAAQILEHYEIGLTGGRNQTTGARLDLIAEFAGLTDAGLYNSDDLADNTYLGRANFTGTVLSTMQSVMVTEQGRLFVDASGVLQVQGRTADMKDLTTNATVQATLSDSGSYAYASPDGIHIQPGTTDLIRNTEYVTAGGGTVVVVDQDSVALFDEREESISTELEDLTAATNLGLSRLRRYADPTTRIDNVTLLPHGAADVRYALVFGVDLGWRLTVTRTPQALGSALSKTVTVEGITHTITEARWITTLYLVPAQATYTEAPWFVFGDATYGTFGTTNLLPY